MATIKLRYSSPRNISFQGVIDTGVDVDDWNDLSDEERDELIAEVVFDRLIECVAINLTD